MKITRTTQGYAIHQSPYTWADLLRDLPTEAHAAIKQIDEALSAEFFVDVRDNTLVAYVESRQSPRLVWYKYSIDGNWVQYVP